MEIPNDAGLYKIFSELMNMVRLRVLAENNTPPSSEIQSEQEPNPTEPLVQPKDTIQELGFLRIWQILGDNKAKPPIKPLLPISKSSFYAGIKKGIYPAPVKLSKRASGWRTKDIRILLESMGRQDK
jgi:prophage regulatory protein